MCNLYSSKMPPAAMRQLFAVSPDRTDVGNLPALSAIYPKYEAPIVTDEGERALILAQWGFLTPNKSKKTGKWLKPQAWNNTRDDKIQTAPLWRDSFHNRRCLIPATAYAEATGRSPAIYHWFRVQNADAFAFAGIWKHQSGTIGDTEIDATTYSMVTTSPNDVAAKYHNRMPLILAPEDYETWLTGSTDDAVALLRPSPAGELQLIASGQDLKDEPS